MRAIQAKSFGEEDVLKLHELQIPEPGEDEVLVEVKAIGVNPVDTYIRAGIYPLLPELPYVPGKDVSGVVIKVGDNVKKWQEGDRVYSSGTVSGGYAEFAVCHHSQVFTLPELMSFNQGAALGVPGAAAWRALFTRARAQKGEKVLIHGASGSVGNIAIQLALSTGLEVHGTAGSEKGLATLNTIGAHTVFTHTDSDYLDHIQTHMGEGNYDIILEMLANVNLVYDLEMLGPRGRVVIIGSRGEITIDPRATMAKETAILGMSLFNCTEAEMKEAQVHLYQEMVAGRLAPSIACEMDLADAPKAHQQVLGSGNCGKILLIP